MFPSTSYLTDLSASLDVGKGQETQYLTPVHEQTWVS
jgi:hypothetical protein